MVPVSKNLLRFRVWIPGTGILWVTDASHAFSLSSGIVFHSFELICAHLLRTEINVLKSSSRTLLYYSSHEEVAPQAPTDNGFALFKTNFRWLDIQVKTA